jgi:hypothetical protein
MNRFAELTRFDPQGLNVSRLTLLEDNTMKYAKPEIVAQADSLQAVQSGTHKKATPTDGIPMSTEQVTVNAYEADE